MLPLLTEAWQKAKFPSPAGHCWCPNSLPSHQQYLKLFEFALMAKQLITFGGVFPDKVATPGAQSPLRNFQWQTHVICCAPTFWLNLLSRLSKCHTATRNILICSRSWSPPTAVECNYKWLPITDSSRVSLFQIKPFVFIGVLWFVWNRWGLRNWQQQHKFTLLITLSGFSDMKSWSLATRWCWRVTFCHISKGGAAEWFGKWNWVAFEITRLRETSVSQWRYLLD